MEHAYTIIFLVGVIYAVITFLIGGLFEFTHFGGNIDMTPHADIGVHVESHIEGHGVSMFNVLPLTPITIVSFITVFGGIGTMGSYYNLNPFLVFLVAIGLGLLVPYILYKWIVIPLYKAQSTSSVFQKQLIGTEAVVISAVMENGFGMISYVVNGSKYNAPAQHLNQKAVAQGQEVLIYEIKDNVFYIQPFNEAE